jgi:dipeptidyl aminopeptidase/acylaminoacyl peptidase
VDLGKATPASDREDAALPLRTRLAGRYEIVDVLGKGGMGAVYLALDEALGGKPIALKLVTRELAEGEALEELRREVVLAQQVTHRNVCRIYDLEQLDGRWMIKMECVSGETLSARIARLGRIAVGEAIAIARQIAAGLGAAHDQGVIHRDLKPGNVMIEEKTGRVVLMDFGIARAAGTDAATDRAGTPSYMAPEQARGERIDERADVYALGCVLYAMLTGEKVPDDAPPDPRAMRPDVPAWLARAVRAMLAPDPRQRPANAADVLRVLTGAERRRAWLLVGVAAVAIAAGAFAIARATRGAAPATREPWHAAIREIEPGYDENADSVAWSPDGRSLAFSSDRERPGWLRGRVRDLARDADDTAVTPPEMNILMIDWTSDGKSLLFTDLASGMKAYRMPASGGTPELIGDGYAIDCGGKLLRFEFGPPPRFVLRDGTTEREVLRLDSNAFVTTYRCDPRGTRVVWSRAEFGAPFYQPADLWIADLATGTARRLTDDRKRNCYPTFTPDGHSIVFTSARGGGVMNLWELPLDGRPARQLTFGNGNDLLADVSPDGTQVVFTVDVTSAPLFAYPGRKRLTPSRVILIDPQVTPDGASIVAADYAPLVPRIVVVTIADGTVRALGDGATSAITVDGKDVVLANDGAISVVPLAGGTPRAVAELDGIVRALRAGPDGTIHAMLDRGTTVEAWAVRLDGEARREADAPWCFVQPAPAGGWSLWMRCAPIEGVLVPPGATPAPDAPGISMRGPMFFGGDFDATGTTFVAYDQPTVLRIDVATGKATPVFDAGLYGATVSPDGKTIYTTEAVGSARRNLITNFASRPR